MRLPFRMEKQKAGYWCWAAVSAGVAHYFSHDSRWRQCGIVKRVLNRAKVPIPARVCGVRPVPASCDVPWPLDDALKEVHRLRRGPKAGRLSFRQIQRELDEHRPVCVRIGWRSGGGHFVVIYGYHTGPGVQQLYVADPLYREVSRVAYHSLASHYRRIGRWTHTYLV